MPSNCQQNMYHYYSDSSYSNSLKMSATQLSPKHHPEQHLKHHHEQHIQLSPGKFVSAVASPHLSFSGSNKQSVPGSTSSISEKLFVEEHDDDNQPLDLSIHPIKDEKFSKQAHEEAHKPVCMIKSCKCNFSNAQFNHTSLYPNVGQSVVRSPTPGMTLSSSTYPASSYSSEKLTTPSSAYNCNFRNNTTSPLGYIPQSSWTSTESSSHQDLTSIENVLNGTHNHSIIFPAYYQHSIEHDINLSPQEQQNGSAIHQPKEHNDALDNDDEPTYMDLDSVSTNSLNTKVRNQSTGNKHYVYSNLSMFENRKIEKLETLNGLNQSSGLQVLNSGVNFNFCETKPAACYTGTVISHTSFEKSKKNSSFPISLSSSGEQRMHQSHQQMYVPHCMSPLSSADLPTGNSSCYSLQPNSPQKSTFQPQHDDGYTRMPGTTGETIYSVIPVSKNQSAYSSNLNLERSGNESPQNKANVSRNIVHNVESTSSSESGCSHPPARTSTRTNTTLGNKYKRAAECTKTGNVHEQISECKDNESSTKISLLDFWISKILMERSSEVSLPNKPCNVDYICTANGEKKIRLRLVDLMELQVEQSLKA